MQLSSFQFRSALVAAGVVASIGSLKAQMYEFKGYIDTSRSDYFSVGEPIDFKITLGAQLADNTPPSFPGSAFYYSVTSGSLLIGGKNYLTDAWFQYTVTATFHLSSGNNGFGEYWESGFDSPLGSFQLDLETKTALVVDSKGILLSGIPLSTFQNPGGNLSDNTHNYEVDPAKGEATWKLTAYDVHPNSSPVPEPSAYGFVATGLLGAIAVLRRRKS